MADNDQSSENRPAAVSFFLAIGLLLMLSRATTAGAQCNPVCSQNTSNTFFGDIAGAMTTGAGNSAFGFGALSGKTSGNFNAAFGSDALASDTAGTNNTATGAFSLEFNTTGGSNTATGTFTLFENDTGSNNTSAGYESMLSNTTGSDNTATGYQTLEVNTTGNSNTATGYQTLLKNTADNNTATGANALFSNQGGDRNTATGMNALFSNTSGTTNTATGQKALFANTTGHHNTADGLQSLLSNTTGAFNTATGLNALGSNTTGVFNVALGFNAGFNLTTGSNNIDIGTNGGAAGENKTIRIGTPGTHTATFIAGIAGTPVSGADVVVNGAGKLGVVVSSARYKQDIQNMGTGSDGLLKLRPVTFRYRNDKQGITQYGLVAEEVEEVYPELVTHGADGKVETVRYSMLTSMLLNELQKQAAKALSRDREFQQQIARIKQQVEQIADLSAQVGSARRQIARLNERDATMRTAFEERLMAVEQAVRTRDGSRTVATALGR